MNASRTHADALLKEESLTRTIIGCFFHVYDRLGFGFLEAVDRRALATSWHARGLPSNVRKSWTSRASDVEIGLLLNFGPKAQFERLVYSNSNTPSMCPTTERLTKIVSAYVRGRSKVRVRPR